MFEDLKQQVWQANIDIITKGLALYTWGNVSGIDRSRGLVIIKPSGVSYDKLQPEDMVVIDLEGKRVKGSLNPSSDTPTHLVLYKTFKNIGAIVHTHSTYAASWAQAMLPLPCLGTTHADYFHGSVPVTVPLSADRISKGYEEETGKSIAEIFKGLNHESVPGVLVAGHGVFTWGETPEEAVENNIVLEEVAKIATYTRLLNPQIKSVSKDLLDKHYLRKHGAGRYYGQEKK